MEKLFRRREEDFPSQKSNGRHFHWVSLCTNCEGMIRHFVECNKHMYIYIGKPIFEANTQEVFDPKLEVPDLAQKIF